jgi:hypothetical protein
MAMTERQQYKRGVVGWTCRWLFVFFNLAMFIWMMSAVVEFGGAGTSTPGQHNIFGAGLALADVAAIAGIWGLGAIILGALSNLTRGPKIEPDETNFVEPAIAPQSGLDTQPGGRPFSKQ